MKLKVPLIRQVRKSVDCGPACLSMILRFYGIKESVSEIANELQIYKSGTYSPQLGSYLIKKGFSVKMITQHPGLFNLKSRTLSQVQIKKHLIRLSRNKKNKKDKISLRYLIDFMNDGGKICVEIPRGSNIVSEIKHNRPVISLLTSNFLIGKDVKFNFHYNVITGIDSKQVYVNDPLWDYRGGRHAYSIEDYLYGVHTSTKGDLDDGCLLKIKKLR